MIRLISPLGSVVSVDELTAAKLGWDHIGEGEPVVAPEAEEEPKTRSRAKPKTRSVAKSGW